MLSYRSFSGFAERQSEKESGKLGDFRAASYQRYQGEKLANRFNAFSYYVLSQSMDAHNIGRGRGTMEKALQQIRAATLVIGIETDILFPLTEQRFLAAHIPGAVYATISSAYGHDGFLLEYDAISAQILDFIENEKKSGPRMESIKMYGNT